MLASSAACPEVSGRGKRAVESGCPQKLILRQLSNCFQLCTVPSHAGTSFKPAGKMNRRPQTLRDVCKFVCLSDVQGGAEKLLTRLIY